VLQEIGTTCCYAKADKAWTVDPQGVAWETFLTLEAAPVYGTSHGPLVAPDAAAAACCSPAEEAPASAACCSPAAAVVAPASGR
jgi:hypothetical protein